MRLDFLKRRIARGQAYRAVFDGPDGRLVLHDLLREGGVLEPSVVVGDVQATAFRDGKRALALHILHELRWSEPELVKLAQSRTDERLAEVA